MVPPSPYLRSSDSTLLYALIFGISLTVFSFCDGTAFGTITTDDNRSVGIADVTVVEGEGGGTTNAVFTVTLNAVNPISTECGPVTVNYATRNNSAASGSDYTATSGTLSFNIGETTKVITVPVNADCNAEATESFIIDLSSPFGTTIRYRRDDKAVYGR